MPLILEIRQADGSVVREILQPGTNRVPVDSASSYRVFDDTGRVAPDRLSVKRIDDDLVIDGLGRPVEGDDTSVVLPGYYKVCSTSSACAVSIDTAGGSPIVVTAASKPIGALADGSFVLHDPNFEPGSLSGAGSLMVTGV